MKVEGFCLWMLQMAQSTDDHHMVREQLAQFDRLLSTVDTLIQIHVALQSIDDEIRQRSFIKAVSSFETAQPLLQSLKVEHPLEQAVVKSLQTELCVTRERLLYELGEAWNQLVFWVLPAESIHNRQQKTSSLSIALSANKQSALSQVVLAMSRVNLLPMRIRTFSERVVTHFIEPVVVDHTSLVQTVVEAEQGVIRVNSIPSPATEQIPVPPSDAFQKLCQILVFLHKMLSGVAVQDSARRQTPLIRKIGKLISGRMFDLVYERSILPALPVGSGNPDTLMSFSTIVAEVEQFHNAVDQLGLLPQLSEDGVYTELLMDRINNASAKFASIRAQELLRQARQLLTQELSQSVHVSASSPISDVTVSCEERSRELDIFVLSCREQATASGLKLPTCQVRYLMIFAVICVFYCSVWVQECCRISPSCFLAQCRNM